MKNLMILVILASITVLTGCGGGDSSNNNNSGANNQGTNQAPASLAGRTMTLTVRQTTFSSTTTASAFAPASLVTTSSTIGTASTTSGSHHHETAGQTYTIHFSDEQNCVIHHPDTGDADEAATYVYNRDAQTVDIQGPEHEMEHLNFTSESEGDCHMEDDAGEAEDDQFVLT